MSNSDFYNRFFVNLTPHAIRVRSPWRESEAEPYDADVVIPASGTVARLAPTRQEKAVIAGQFKLDSISFAEVEGLPEYEEGQATYYIVSMPVGQAVHRSDVIVPDTQPDSSCIRDERGQIFAVRGFVQFV